MSKIFISIASFRDKELIPTIKDCLANADNPDNLSFGIAWQHAVEDEWDNLNEFKDDTRFTIIDVNYKDSKGVCWARSEIQKLYKNEDYYFQLDSHHRFIKGWDSVLIDMLKKLQEKGHEKPLLTAYLPSYEPSLYPEGKINQAWFLRFNRFGPEGVVHPHPEEIPGWENMTEPVNARFLSGHFIFTLGKFAREVPYDPDYFFHGEEISMAVRSYTHGYDLLHPHRPVAWHHYTRRGAKRPWDPDSLIPKWGDIDNNAKKKNRELFGIGTTRRNFGKYGFGRKRSLKQYEDYAGIRFSDRTVQPYTADNGHNPPPNPDSNQKFAVLTRYIFDIAYTDLSYTDYEYICIFYDNAESNFIYRETISPDRFPQLYNDADGYIKVESTFWPKEHPVKAVMLPFRKGFGWSMSERKEIKLTE